MRSLLFLFLILPILSYGQVVIKGKIHNYDGESVIYYTPTLDGIFAPNFRTQKPSQNGNFKITFKNEGYGTAKFSIKGISYRLFYDSNSTILLEIDQAKIQFPKKITDWYSIADSIKQLSKVKISGDYEEVNNYYNNNLHGVYSAIGIVYGSYYSDIIYKAETPQKVIHLIDSLVQREINQVNNLSDLTSEKSKKVVNDEIKDFLKDEIKSFYGAVFLNGMFQKRQEQARILAKNPDAELVVYNSQWIKLTESFCNKVKNEINPLLNSNDYMELLQALYYNLKNESFKKYRFKESVQSLDDQITEQLFHTDSVLQMSSEANHAFHLYELKRFLENQLWYSPTLLNAVREFQQKYPYSEHINYFKPQVEKLEQYLLDQSLSFNDAHIIRTNYTTFPDVLENFKGQNLLIDIWATWCMPCVKEFQHKAILEPYVKNKQLTVLYISIDKPQWEDRWKENIKYNKLAGYHIRANNELLIDMWDTIGGQRGAIPRYVLVNSDGEIVVPDAARPSEKEKLITEIEKLIEGSKE